jgi:hypothetical protein
MAKADLELETTVRTLLREDGRLHFIRPRAMRERLLECTLSALWLLVAVVVVAALWL